MSYWIYENWTAENKAKLHRGSCSFCNEGLGIHDDKEEGRNGRWHGPFNTFSEARNYAQNLNRTVSYCGFCKPEA